MTEKLKTYHLRLKFLEDLRYGQFFTAKSEEDAMKQFLDEYVYIQSERKEV
jgi:hypothetical protein